MIKRIFICVALIVLLIVFSFDIYQEITNIRIACIQIDYLLKETFSNEHLISTYRYDIFICTLQILKYCIFIFFIIFAIYLIIKKSNFTNYTRLAYEEFKEKRIAKKENKRKAKIEKLQKQLNEIEKDA